MLLPNLRVFDQAKFSKYRVLSTESNVISNCHQLAQV